MNLREKIGHQKTVSSSNKIRAGKPAITAKVGAQKDKRAALAAIGISKAAPAELTLSIASLSAYIDNEVNYHVLADAKGVASLRRSTAP